MAHSPKYEKETLYDWIRLSEKSTKRRIKTKKVGDAADDPEFDETDDELNIRPVKKSKDGKIETVTEEQPLSDFIEDDIGCKNESEDEDELDVMDEPSEATPKDDQSFMPDHSQYRTHQARMKHEDHFILPNFLPGTLPRSDRGD